MQRMFLIFLALVCCVVVWSPPPAYAEAPAVAEHYELGKAALDAGKPADALGHFKTALTQADLSLGSTWQMLLAVALTYQELEQPSNSAQMFRRFLEVTEAHGELMTEKWRTRREVVRKQLTLLEQELSKSHAVVMITSTPPGAAVSVDGARAGIDGDAVTPTRLWLAPGEHTIGLVLQGFESTTRTMMTRAGGLDSYSPTLTSLGAAMPTPAPSPAVTLVGEPEATAGSVGPWVLLGGAGAAAIVGGVMLGLAEGEAATLAEIAAKEDPGTTDGVNDHKDFNRAQDNLATYDAVAWAMFGVAGAAAIGGVLWWLLDGDGVQETEAAFGLIPTTKGVHAHASWRF
ncbi:MAG: PEGA domain-containing protein [Myxococcota bacterium]